jgi:uncharacterized protein (TIGR00299 family) protein
MIWWIDAGAGASGDMLLGALLSLDPSGLHPAQQAVDAVLTQLGATEHVQLDVQEVRRNGLAATRALVQAPEKSAPRTWREIHPALLGNPAAHAVFESLAEAEAYVHGCAVEDVHFHEVGALDAIADIVAVTTLWERLAPERVVVSHVCVGSGSVQTAHGRLPVPTPAVTQLLQGTPTFAGAVAHEACTPTGAALLAFLADDWGPQPAMVVQAVGTGAGGRDPESHPNVVRVLAGDVAQASSALILIETTVDDLDPRVYPEALDAARAAGALEAWITPVVMKHGRPGVVVSALSPPMTCDAVTETLAAANHDAGREAPHRGPRGPRSRFRHRRGCRDAGGGETGLVARDSDHDPARVPRCAEGGCDHRNACAGGSGAGAVGRDARHAQKKGFGRHRRGRQRRPNT